MATRLFEANDVALALGVSSGTVRNLALRGELRVAAVTPRGTRLFRPEDVLAYEQRRHRAHAKEN